MCGRVNKREGEKRERVCLCLCVGVGGGGAGEDDSESGIVFVIYRRARVITSLLSVFLTNTIKEMVEHIWNVFLFTCLMDVIFHLKCSSV